MGARIHPGGRETEESQEELCGQVGVPLLLDGRVWLMTTGTDLGSMAEFVGVTLTSPFHHPLNETCVLCLVQGCS